MTKPKVPRMIVLMLAAGVTLGCGPATEPKLSSSVPASRPTADGTASAALESTPPIGSGLGALEERPDPPEVVPESWLILTATAPLDEIAVQLDYQGTYVWSPPFARAPVFTLYMDGTVVYIPHQQKSRLLTKRISVPHRDAIIRGVLDRGAESFTSRLGCPTRPPKADGLVVVCPSHDAYAILRVRRPSGELYSVIVYSGNFGDIPDFLNSAIAGGTPFVPEHGTLIARRLSSSPPECPPGSASLLLRPSPEVEGWAAVLDETAVQRLLRPGETESRTERCIGSVAYRVVVFPWMPRMDHTRTLSEYAKREFGQVL